jgi:transposase
MSDETDPSNIVTLLPKQENQEVKTLPTEVGTFDQEKMYQRFVRGVTLAAIAEEFGISYATIKRYKDKLDWEERKQRDIAQKAFLDETEIDTIARETYSKLLKVCYRLVSDIERSVFEVDAEQQARTVPLKTITDAVEKLTKLHYFAQAGGVEKRITESKHTQVNVDYAKMAELYMSAKKDGVNYDAKAHLKDVIEGKFTRVKKDREEEDDASDE